MALGRWKCRLLALAQLQRKESRILHVLLCNYVNRAAAPASSPPQPEPCPTRARTTTPAESVSILSPSSTLEGTGEQLAFTSQVLSYVYSHLQAVWRFKMLVVRTRQLDLP